MSVCPSLSVDVSFFVPVLCGCVYPLFACVRMCLSLSWYGCVYLCVFFFFLCVDICLCLCCVDVTVFFSWCGCVFLYLCLGVDVSVCLFFLLSLDASLYLCCVDVYDCLFVLA